MKKSCPKDLRNKVKKNNTNTVEVPKKRRERVKGVEHLYKEIVTLNFLNLGKIMDIQTEKAQKTPNRRNPKKSTMKTHYNQIV